MNIEMLIAVFTVLLTLSMAAERFIEVLKPVFNKINLIWQPSVKIVTAALVGFGLAALFHFDLLFKLGVLGTLPVVGYALSGLVASSGSSVLHPILEWLKTLKNDTTITTTKTTGDVSSAVVVEKTTAVESKTVPPVS